MKRRALGRGLSALIPDRAEPEQRKDDYYVCPIERIEPFSQQPRKSFDDEKLEELAASVREKGIVEPLVVRPAKTKGRYELIAGERRWRAAQIARLHEVPVVIREVDDREALEIALIENLHRDDLNPIEKASAFQEWMEQSGLTQEQLAEKIGFDRSTVANSLRLLKLPEVARRALANGAISSGHARALLSLEKSRTIQRALKRVLDGGLSVRQTEALVRRLLAGESAEGTKQQQERLSANAKDLQDRLSRTLQTRVQLHAGKGQRGRIEIHYGSLDELDRLLEALGVR